MCQGRIEGRRYVSGMLGWAVGVSEDEKESSLEEAKLIRAPGAAPSSLWMTLHIHLCGT